MYSAPGIEPARGEGKEARSIIGVHIPSLRPSAVQSLMLSIPSREYGNESRQEADPGGDKDPGIRLPVHPYIWIQSAEKITGIIASGQHAQEKYEHLPEPISNTPVIQASQARTDRAHVRSFGMSRKPVGAVF